jgi:hypothetical protein
MFICLDEVTNFIHKNKKVVDKNNDFLGFSGSIYIID